MRAMFRIPGNESQRGLQLIKKLATPLTVTSSQRPFSSVPNVAVLERFDSFFFFIFLQEVLFSIPSKSVIGWTSLSQRYLHCQKNYDYRKQSAWFFPLEMYSYSFLRVLCNTHCFSDYSIKVFYGSGECLVLNIPTSDSDDIPEIVRRLEEISIGCQVKLFFCVSSLYIGKHCPVKSNYSLPA